MTRKEYELITSAIDRARAHILARTRHSIIERANGLNAVEATIVALAHSLKNENPRFNVDRFFIACTEGPLFLAAQNDEPLARELGPGKRKACAGGLDTSWLNLRPTKD